MHDVIAVSTASQPDRDWKQALLRGLSGHCPHCGTGQLFTGWLKPANRCLVCQEDLTPQRADDFPAYLVILLLGHIVVPIVVAVNMEWDLPQGLQMIMWPALTALLALLLIRPAKGAVIAVQWALGMGGFGTRLAASAAERDAA